MVKNYKAFDVILVNFGKIEFDGEQGGVRPAIIIQNELGNIHSPCTIVIPLTSKIKHIEQPTHSFFGKDKEKGLEKDSILLGECVRQISEKRIIKKLGSIKKLEDKKEIKRVFEANFEVF